MRRHLDEPDLRLPQVSLYAGGAARLLMRVLKMGAITFGRHVFVAPQMLEREDNGRVGVPGWLVVHEAVHVLQYERAGYLRFFFNYLRGYWQALRAGGRWDAVGRMDAYMAIAEERAAREAEHAYRLAKEAADGST